MNGTDVEEPDLPLPILILANQLCNRLEQGWREGQPPELESLLAGVPVGDRLPILNRLLALEIDYRRLRGEHPSLKDYQARFPEITALPQEHASSATVQTQLVSTEEFLSRLQRWALLRSEDHEREAAQEGSPPERVTRLVEQGLLTHFQAGQLIRPDGIPLVFDDYVLLDQRGSGGMGTVYRAYHRRMHKVVALKTATGPTTSAQRTRFERETRAAARLTHPHVVATMDAGEANGMLYMIMEWIEGRDLGRVVREDGPLPLPKALDYLRQAALGLQHAHERGIIHRDVKPGNLILDSAGTVRVLDLGLAYMMDLEHDPVTTSGTVLGTRDYLAPEQVLAPSQVDARADVYGLGCTLCYLLTGRPPTPTINLRKLPPSVPALLRRMCAPSPLDRPRSMTAVLEELAHLDRPRRGYLSLLGAALLLTIGLLLAWRLLLVDGTTAPSLESYPLADPVNYQKRWADHLGLPIQYRDEHGMTFALIPPARLGTRTVSHPFYLATTETTTAQFRRYVATQAVAFQTRAERDEGWGLLGGEWVLRPGFSWHDLGELKLLDDHPALNVTGEEAERYCRWRTDAEHLYRLPSELEWEHACRAGTLDRWCFGEDEKRLSQFAWTIEKSGRSPHPVSQLRANAFGLFDMHGNHAEWCRPEDPTAKEWPTRGGGFLSLPDEVTCTARKLLPPIHLEAGFRVLREIPVEVLHPQTQE